MVDRRLNNTGNEILAYIRSEGRATSRMIVRAMGYRQQCIQSQLKHLCELGKLTQVDRGLYEIAG